MGKKSSTQQPSDLDFVSSSDAEGYYKIPQTGLQK